MTASNAGIVHIGTSRPVRLFLDGREIAQGATGGRYDLPEGWRSARHLAVRVGRRHVLGSPLDIAALTRCESFVEAAADGLRGWIWTPAEPEHVPVITLWNGSTLRAEDFAQDVDSDVPLARYRVFHVPAKECPERDEGPLELWNENGRLLTGAPVDPLVGKLVSGQTRGLPARLRPVKIQPGRMRPHLPRQSPGCAVVIPVYADRVRITLLAECVRDSAGPDVPVVVVDDATPVAALAADLDRLAAAGTIRLVRHARTLGFPASANDGMRAMAGHDVVLLNSDTLVAGGWLAELADVAYGAADIGTVTPLSNQASIFSWPGPDRAPDAEFCPAFDLARVRHVMAAARAANRGVAVDVPTGHGFCLFIRHDCLDAFWRLQPGAPDSGPLRADLFAQGYGEENDFCLRAAAGGWRHVAAPGAFVGHVGGASFGAARPDLLRRNLDIVNALHPGYDARVAAHVAADPLFAARRRLDLVCWRRGGAGWDGAVLLVTHDQGGGVERVVRARAAAWRAQGARPVVLRPAPGGCRLEDVPDTASGPSAAAFASPRFRLPGEGDMLLAVLRASGVDSVEWHHSLGHGIDVRTLAASLGVPYEVHVHDYVWFCPRVALVGASGRYCGEPGPAGCAACLAPGGSLLEDGEGTIPDRLARHLARSRADLLGARAVMAPSDDAARRIGRHFPEIAVRVTPLEDDRPGMDLASFVRIYGGVACGGAAPAGRARPAGRVRVAVPGAIGVEKGYGILLEAARDAAARDLNLEFVVVGHTPDDDALIGTGRVFVTGPYRESDSVALLAAQGADLALLPSVWPETWCFALGLAWRAGLRAVVFDLGAMAERVRRTGRGRVLPLGMPIHELNTFLLSYA
ncbi:glycosyltransferase [Gluconacetobacter diazotrophicus]|uniref:Putative glycosyl transferase n=1 Tax=Gluconacetobacter diazotrophicus (strain ATCC 49037 / DSM 5601 / CCUG 37298 / CIP 103539 / LMG 7603 / PAl5) TaxID=272568 RepID=A9H4H6_GLUDA|nr:glycosyltransferase [Gluconacetobacter diazotrophicus]CAP57438.1 putative glycosyl transferase [Gluconacetobacter diazotrophicus PA1 5]